MRGVGLEGAGKEGSATGTKTGEVAARTDRVDVSGSEAAAAPPLSASVPTLPCSRRLRRSSRARSVALWTRSGGKVAAEEGGWVAVELGGGPVAATAFGATGRAEDDEEVLVCPGGELDSPMQLRARDTKNEIEGRKQAEKAKISFSKRRSRAGPSSERGMSLGNKNAFSRS